MRAVIYDAEAYEPLTVIDIPQAFVREIEQGKRQPILHFPIPAPVVVSNTPIDEPLTPNVITVRFNSISDGQKRLMWMCTTEDAASALLLRTTFLPGQQRRLNREIEEAFLKGLFTAMSGG